MAQQSAAFKQFQLACKAYVKTVPRLLGRAALAHVGDNFRRGSFEEESGRVVPWAPRARPDMKKGRKGKDGKRGKAKINPRQRALLVETGRLRRSIRVVSTDARSATIGTDVPYAEALQEGNKKMPARPFMVAGKSLATVVRKQVMSDIKKLLKK